MRKGEAAHTPVLLPQHTLEPVSTFLGLNGEQLNSIMHRLREKTVSLLEPGNLIAQPRFTLAGKSALQYVRSNPDLAAVTRGESRPGSFQAVLGLLRCSR